MTEQKLQASAMLILSSLADGDRHGYAIRKDIARRTGEDVRLGLTTLYRLLKQLLDGGLVEESEHRPAPALDDERRRYYRITAAGRRVLASHRTRWQEFIHALVRVAGIDHA